MRQWYRGWTALVLLLLSLFCTCSWGVVSRRSGWTVEQYPNPTIPAQASACGAHTSGGGTSYLCDPDELLSKTGTIMVHRELERLSREVKVECRHRAAEGGLQVAVALMSKMKPMRLSWEATQEAEAFARKLHDKWGVGDAACNDGALVLLSSSDRAMYISRGSALDRLLTDTRLESILEAMKPLLRQEQYEEAVLLALSEIPKQIARGPPGFWEDYGGLLFIAFLAVCALMVMGYSWRESRRKRAAFDDAKRKLERIDQEKERLERLAKAGQFGALISCPVCLEEFKDAPTASNGGAPSAPPQSAAGGSSPPTTTESEEGRPLMQGGNSSGNLTDKLGVDGKPVAVLDCGHAFCVACLLQSIEASTKCPICRQDIAGLGGGAGGGGGGGGGNGRGDDDQGHGGGGAGGGAGVMGGRGGRPAAPGGTTSNRRPPTGGCQPAGFEDPGRARVFAEAELLYRLRSLQRQHPDFITQDHVDRWSRGGYNGPNMARDPSFLAQDPRVSQSSSSGYRPSSSYSSFGGGRSSGGRGSSW